MPGPYRRLDVPNINQHVVTSVPVKKATKKASKQTTKKAAAKSTAKTAETSTDDEANS